MNSNKLVIMSCIFTYLFYYYFIFLLLHINFYRYQNYVELSASNIRYIAYLPLVTKAWNRIGFYVNIFIVYNNLTVDICIVHKKLSKLKCKVVLLQFNKTVSLHYISKMSRIFGFMIHTNNYNNFYYLSDADIFPVSKSYFNEIEHNKLTIKSFDRKGYGYGNNKGKWAMCYMVANRRTWNDILTEDIIDNNIKDTILSTTILELRKGEKYFERYSYIDEVYLRDKIKNWKYFDERVTFIVRQYNRTRIDRNKLTNESLLNVSNIIDIHLPSLTSNIYKKWKNKIIPLQKHFFSSIPYDTVYIESLFEKNK